jgi:hypothetical protein
MKKLLILFSIILLFSTSCASTKYFEIDGKVVEAKPYGWINKNARKDDRIVYEVNPGNIALSILGVETIVVPVWLTGWQLFEPVKVKE